MSSRLIETKDFMQLNKPSFIFKKIHINIRDICHEVLGFMFVLANKKQAPLFVSISDDIPATGLFDRERLQQIMCALLTNAIGFSNS